MSRPSFKNRDYNSERTTIATRASNRGARVASFMLAIETIELPQRSPDDPDVSLQSSLELPHAEIEALDLAQEIREIEGPRGRRALRPDAMEINP